MVWEMFDSVAYDARKFEAMLDQALDFARREAEIRRTAKSEWDERTKLAKFRLEVYKDRRQRGAIRRPPRGFTVDKAKDLFRMTGDLATED